MSSKVKVLRSTVAGKRPTGKEFGELWVNDKDKVMGYIDSGGLPVVPFALPSDIVIHKFNATVAYRPGDVVLGPDGELWIAKAAVVAGAWDATKWNHSGDSRFVNLTGDTMTGPLHVPDWSASPAGNTDDIAMNHKSVAAMIQVEQTARVREDGLKVAKAGDTMTGALNLPATAPTVATHATTKKYVDDQDALKVSKAGDTLTGALNLPTGVPTGNNAVSRTEGDKLYVNVSGDTMTGALHLPADGLTVGTNQLVFKGGDLGLGVTPNAWQWPVLQAQSASFSGGLNDRAEISYNYFRTSGKDLYIGAGFAESYKQAGGEHQWLSAPSGSANAPITWAKAMVLDAYGNLGLGGQPNVGTWPGMQIGNAIFSGGNSDRASMSYNYNRVSGANSYLTTDVATLYQQVAGAHTWYNAPSGTAGNPITFTQAMTLTPSGNLGLGTAAPAGASGRAIAIYGGAEQTRIALKNDSTTDGPANGLQLLLETDGSASVEHRENKSLKVIVNSTGGVVLAPGATAWAALSDERLKEIIEPIDNAASKVATLRAVIGKYKTDDAGTRRAFLIAQDVQRVLPEAVDATTSENLSLRYSELIPLLVAAIKEQQALITDLQTRLAALEAKP